MVAEVVDIIVVDLMSFTQIRFHDFKVILAEKLKQAFQRGQGPPSGHNKLEFQCPFRRGGGCMFFSGTKRFPLFTVRNFRGVRKAPIL